MSASSPQAEYRGKAPEPKGKAKAEPAPKKEAALETQSLALGKSRL